MQAVVAIILSDLIPLRKRAKYQGIINVIFVSRPMLSLAINIDVFVKAMGCAIGGPLGGIMVDFIGWRWYLYSFT
jgi:MFS family permease